LNLAAKDDLPVSAILASGGAPALAPVPRRRRPASRHDLAFARDVLAGLAAPRKAIAARRLHDEHGAGMLEGVATGDEIQSKGMESTLLSSSAASIAAFAGAGARVTDLSGRPGYGATFLAAAIAALGRLPASAPCRRLLYVPGQLSATLPCDATTARLLREAADRGRHDVVVVAASAARDPAILLAGPGDSGGATAARPEKLLLRINRELGGDFDPDAFDCARRFDPYRQCVETQLVSVAAQHVRVLGRCFRLAAGESILVERQYSHCLPRFEALAHAAGWQHAQRWVDSGATFAIHVLERA